MIDLHDVQDGDPIGTHPVRGTPYLLQTSPIGVLRDGQIDAGATRVVRALEGRPKNAATAHELARLLVAHYRREATP